MKKIEILEDWQLEDMTKEQVIDAYNAHVIAIRDKIEDEKDKSYDDGYESGEQSGNHMLERSVEKFKKALALAQSMIAGREDVSPESEKIFKEAFNSTCS